MPEELVERAASLGYAALAITDECSMAGVVRAHAEAKKSGLHLMIGSEFILEDGLRLVCLAMNRNGYGNLCELITWHGNAPKKALTASAERILKIVRMRLIWRCYKTAWSYYSRPYSGGRFLDG